MDGLETLIARLEREARRTNERRALVLQGSREATDASVRAVSAWFEADRADVVVVGERPILGTTSVDPKRTESILGTTTELAVFDAQDSCRPNALGRLVGTVDGGGLFVLCCPPLAEWADRSDGFDASLAAYPYDAAAVSGAFRARLADLLRVHPGIAIVDADTGAIERDGLRHPAPRRPSRDPTLDWLSANGIDGSDRAPPEDRDRKAKPRSFPRAVYEECLTADQARCVRSFERLESSKTAIVAEADRGRGKSSAAGLAAGALAARGNRVLVTAPRYRASAEAFVRAAAVLDSLGVAVTADSEENPHRLDTPAGSVRFASPMAAVERVSRTDQNFDGGAQGSEPDVVFVDEAAALPVSVLDRLLDAGRIAFTTTVHGYEGTGRGFAIRFRERLAASDHDVRDVRLSDPVRHAAGDPLEIWAFRALLLDARPAVDPLVAGATPETSSYERVSKADLTHNEGLLREVFGLLVAAHYRTEPNDLARVLCAPNLAVRALSYDGHVVSVCLLAREGGLPVARRRDLHDGGRINGHLLPDVLVSQLQDEAAGEPRGLRVVRIATHAAVRSRGLGSRLLDRVERECRGRTPDRRAADRSNGSALGSEGPIDWLGVAYGATPALLRFWRANGFETVHVSTTRNDRSGEHSALMGRALTDRGAALTRRHSRWFAGRFPAVVSDALRDLDPDVVRGALRAVGEHYEPDLSARDRHVIEGAAAGTGLYETDPRPFRRLARTYFTDSGTNVLSAREERLLVRRVFQARPPEAIAADLHYESRRQCLRALGDAYRTLLDHYGDADG